MGPGGNGGKGGIGGNAGNIEIVDLNNFTTRKGQNGERGDGSNGGLSGKSNRVVTNCKINRGIFSDSFELIDQHSFDTSDPSGADGCDGCVGTPKPPQPQFQMIEKALVLNEFKILLRKNFNEIDQTSVIDFYNFLEENDKIFGHYDTLSFVDEFNGLEEQFQILGSNSLKFYDSLSRRVKKYSLKLGEQGSKKVLIYLYSAILSKINFINSNWYSGFVMI